MKNNFKILLAFGVALLSLSACKKDEVKVYAEPDSSPKLTASTTAANLNPASPTSDAIGFNWTSVNYGYDAVVSYVLQISQKDSNFTTTANTTEVSVVNGSRTFTVEELNRELVKILPYNKEAVVAARVLTYVGVRKAVTYSNVLTFTATPYKVLIPYPSLWIAGNFQGWSPSTAPTIASEKDDGRYEGYIYFNDANPEFKMVKGNDWSFGDYGDGGGGKLTNGGDNLKITTGVGFYLLKGNTDKATGPDAMTWSYLKTTWGIIGNAIPGTGWDSDVDMVFDPASLTWSVTLDMQPGEFKFRANHSWDDPNPNFGDNNSDGIPEFKGENIKITEAAKYQVVLDLSSAGPKNYSYMIKKQ